MVYSEKSSTKKISLKEEVKTEGQAKERIKKLKGEHEGHRKRAKERVKRQDISSFSNSEIIEALLFFCNSRRDTKPEAKILDKLSNGSILNFYF